VKEEAIKARDAVALRLTPDQIQRAQAWKSGRDVDLALGTAATQAAPARPTGPSSGTGLVITKTGHVLTNFHVVDSCTSLRARVPGESAIPMEVVAKDPLNDLAVAKLASPLPRVATFRTGQPLRQGDAVVVFGFPLGDALASEGNLTTGYVSALAGVANDSRHLQISAPVQPGNSGGPLVDMSGNVIGVVVSKLNALAVMKLAGDVPQNVNFAIKAGVAEGFLEANGIEYQTSPSAVPLQIPDVGERIKRFTVRIDCSR
jgi:S1-C subfamily serine protease